MNGGYVSGSSYLAFLQSFFVPCGHLLFPLYLFLLINFSFFPTFSCWYQLLSLAEEKGITEALFSLEEMVIPGHFLLKFASKTKTPHWVKSCRNTQLETAAVPKGCGTDQDRKTREGNRYSLCSVLFWSQRCSKLTKADFSV